MNSSAGKLNKTCNFPFSWVTLVCLQPQTNARVNITQKLCNAAYFSIARGRLVVIISLFIIPDMVRCKCGLHLVQVLQLWCHFNVLNFVAGTIFFNILTSSRVLSVKILVRLKCLCSCKAMPIYSSWKSRVGILLSYQKHRPISIFILFKQQ